MARSMTDQRPRPPEKERKNKALALNYTMIQTLAHGGHSNKEISNMMGKSDDYLRNRCRTDKKLAEVLKQAREDRDDGLNYDYVEQLAAQGCSQEQIGQSMGYSGSFIANRKKEDDQLKAALEQGQAKGIVKVTNALFTKATNGDLGAMCFYLKNKAGWKDRFDVDTSTHNHYYLEGRPEAKSIDEWQDQHTPYPQAPTTQQ